MDVIFLKSNELNWEENYQRACDVIGKKNIFLLDGTKATSIKNAYEIVLDHVRSDLFMMIEGDNYVFDCVTKYLDMEIPIKFWTTNKYGVEYEHGGIKIMNVNDCKKQIKTNLNIFENFEISANLFLKSSTHVLSEHRFDWSEKNEWVAIAKELIKLHLWAKTDFIGRWTKYPFPAEIYKDVKIMLEDKGFTQVFETLLPSLGEIYDSKFKK